MKKRVNEGNQIHNFISSSGSGTVNNYGSGSDFLTSYGSGSTSQKVTVPTVPVPQHWFIYLSPQGRGWDGELTREKVIRTLPHKAGRKSQHD